MSGFLRNLRLVTKFDGDTVTFTMRPINKMDFLELMPAMQAAGGDNQSSKTTALLQCTEVLARHCDSVEGLTDADGQPLDISDILSNAYFMPLTNALFEQWINASTFREKTPVKKPSKP